MSTTRRISLILGSALAIAVIVVLATYHPSSVTKQTSLPFTGMGEFRRFEVQQVEAPAVVGIGDLRRFEVQSPLSIIPVTGGSAASGFNIGMGNLRRFEGQPSNQDITIPKSSLPVTIAALPRSNHNDKISKPGDPSAKGPGR